ncbi:Bug family tripartite tricarboxylate transporter substrate binding protein [Roseomonas sp. BN140053]|uniref:Bug family tripartite tricarboxylate transporter substrate binding protein n=1 Tax=Roseomonas sp. BN140053 TaxID=3391898 RepID=UPI0039E9448C
MRRRAFLAAAAGATLLPGAARAAEYPDRPIRLLVPFSAGGAPDVAARIMARQVSIQLGQGVVIENRTGANGIIASEMVAKARPDGYNLLYTTGSHAINPSLYRRLPYDTEADFTPISLLLVAPAYILVVNNELPVRSVADLVARARAGQVTFGSPGVGNSIHMAAEGINQLAGVSMVHVPFRGATQALEAVVTGQVDCMFLNPLAALPVINEGRVRAIAVSSRERFDKLPELPTVAEGGVPGYEMEGGWNALYGPPALPAAIVTRLVEEFRTATRVPEVRAQLEEQGNRVVASDPEVLAAKVGSEVRKFAALTRAAGIEPQ